MPTTKKTRPAPRKPSAPSRKPSKAHKKAAPPAKSSARKASRPAAKKSAPPKKASAKKAAPKAKATQAAPAAKAPKMLASAKALPAPAAKTAKSPKTAKAAPPPMSVPVTTLPVTTEAPGSTASTYLLVLSGREKKGRRFVRLKSPTVLAWFQRAWRLAIEGRGWAGDLGGEVHGLDALFDAVESRKLPVPPSEAILIPLITKLLRAERDLEVEPHFVHVETDDDDLEIEYFFFDDVFLDSGEALDRLPSPKRRPVPVDEEEPVADDDTFAADDDDDDPYTLLIAELADT